MFDIAVWEIHPIVVHFPIAFVLAAAVLDAAALRWRRLDDLASPLAIAGAISAVLALIAGIVAMQTVPSHTEEGHELMWLHGGLQGFATVAWIARTAINWRSRALGTPLAARAIGWIAALVLVFASAVGGHLVFHLGVGVQMGDEPPAAQEHGHGSHAH